jgi:hypothetical protein
MAYAPCAWSPRSYAGTQGDRADNISWRFRGDCRLSAAESHGGLNNTFSSGIGVRTGTVVRNVAVLPPRRLCAILPTAAAPIGAVITQRLATCATYLASPVILFSATALYPGRLSATGAPVWRLLRSIYSAPQILPFPESRLPMLVDKHWPCVQLLLADLCPFHIQIEVQALPRGRFNACSRSWR